VQKGLLREIFVGVVVMVVGTFIVTNYITIEKPAPPPDPPQRYEVAPPPPAPESVQPPNARPAPETRQTPRTRQAPRTVTICRSMGRMSRLEIFKISLNNKEVTFELRPSSPEHCEKFTLPAPGRQVFWGILTGVSVFDQRVFHEGRGSIDVNGGETLYLCFDYYGELGLTFYPCT
jgi:hypothetical protein